MKNQENSEILGIDAIGFAARLAQVIQHTGLNQSEFSRRLGASAGFVSDAVRGLKKPGAEFLYGVKTVFGASIDWLLTGEGTMQSANRIDLALLNAIRLQVSVARMAIIEGDATAQALLLLIREGLLQQATNQVELATFLDQIIHTEGDWQLAIELYNGHLWTDNSDIQRRNLLEAAISHFEARKPVDKLSSLIARTPKQNIQINIASSQRIAGGDYHQT